MLMPLFAGRKSARSRIEHRAILHDVVPERPMPEQDDSNWGPLLGIGLHMLAGVGLGVLIGQWLDRRHGWTPWGTVICASLGLAAGMYNLIKEGMRANRDPEDRKPKDPDDLSPRT
jgi:F0F1-type ATP synthase assembly protein I